MTALPIETAEVFEPLLEPARYKGAFGGRGSGKSHFFAELMVEECVMNPAQRNVCIREVQKSLEHSSKRLIEDKIAKFAPYGIANRFRILNTHIELRDGAGCDAGGVIIFQGMQNHTSDSIKSLEGFDRGWVEEAAALSKRSLTLLRPTIRKPGSQLWFSWNAVHSDDAVDHLLRVEKPPRSIVVNANYYDNPWFWDTELVEEMEHDKRRNPDKYQHVWLGAYLTHTEARVFRNWRIGDPADFKGPTDRYWFGGDFGFANDPTVLVRCYIEGRRLYIDGEVYKVHCDIDKTPFLWAGAHDKELRDMLPTGYAALTPGERLSWKGIPGARRWPIVADCARPESISFLKRHGFPKIRAAKKGKDSVEEGIEFLQGYDIIVHPDCKHVIDELTLYSFKIDPRTDEVLPILEDKSNHTIDSLRYAIEPLRRGRVGLF